MPAAISPTAASRCWRRASAFELLEVSHVLKCEQQPRIAARRLQLRGRQSKVDLPSVSRSIGRLDAEPPPRLRASAKIRSHVGRQPQDILDSTTDDRRRDVPGNRFSRPVERQNAPLAIGRGKAAGQAIDDVLTERLQVGDLARGAFEMRAGSL